MEELILETFAEVRKAAGEAALQKWYVVSNPRGADQAIWDPYLLLGMEAGPRRICVSFYAPSDVADNISSSRLMVEGSDDQTQGAHVSGCDRSLDAAWLFRFLSRVLDWTISTAGVSWAKVEQEMNRGA